jgi:bifunctional non-homologous end joining protein LigD
VYQPQLAVLVRKPPSGGEWIHEIKYDGYRIGCFIRGKTVTLISRNGKDWTATFPEIVRAAGRLQTKDALLDGEVAIELPGGRTSFQALQNGLSGGSRKGLVYFVFDLLRLNGTDLTADSLEVRKKALRKLIGSRARGRIRYSQHVDGDGESVLEAACRLGVEGIVSKRRDAPYKGTRTALWLKTKCVARQELIIGGFTEPEGSRTGIGALLVGYNDANGSLRFAGKVGTGFSQRAALDLRKRLDAILSPDTPFTPAPAGALRHAHWVQPKLVVEVAFSEWTNDGRMRHPSFQGLREDKSPRDVVLERVAPTSPKTSVPAASAPRPSPNQVPSGAAGRPEVAGIGISHPERQLYPDVGLTKLDLAKLYEDIAQWVMPHLSGRPLTLLRCPQGMAGTCFYSRHSKVWTPPSVRRVRIREKTKTDEHLVVESLPGLISLVQVNVLEIHTWNSTIDHLEQPDRLVFDIDPGPSIQWRQVIEAARLVRKTLKTVGFESFVKTTGGRGLHVVVPLVPAGTWEECFEFSRAIAEAVVHADPRVYTVQFAKAGRENKILIDYFRNNRTHTSIAAYSTRARPGAPLSMPLSWDELDDDLRSDGFTAKNLRQRLARVKTDPWKRYWSSRQRLAFKR